MHITRQGEFLLSWIVALGITKQDLVIQEHPQTGPETQMLVPNPILLYILFL